MNNTVVISSDSHVVEPPDLWVSRIESRFRDRAPRLVSNEKEDYWQCEGAPPRQVGGMGVAGKPSDQVRREGRFDKDVPRSGWDPKARVEPIAADGVKAEVLYPTVGLGVYQTADRELRLASLMAYNDWIADFCSAFPNRYKGIAMLDIEDPAWSAQELRRTRKKGLVGGMISMSSEEEEEYPKPQYEPFWAAAQETDSPISLHIVTAKRPVTRYTPGMGATADVHVRRCLAGMIAGGLFQRFPTLKVVSAENDIGWVPYFMERSDYIAERRQHQSWFTASRTALPSDQIRQHVHFTFMRDRCWVPLRETIGIDRIMWASDYPHLDSTWPKSREAIEGILKGVPEAESRKVVGENAAKLYGFDIAAIATRSDKAPW